MLGRYILCVKMPSPRQTRLLETLCILLLWPSMGLTHMEMDWPYPLRSKYNPQNDYTLIDYSMTSPLNTDGTNFPCKGYQNDRPFQSVTTYSAGSTYNISLAGSATHGGGSCQISLSYDNGATFRVIKSIIGGCLLSSTYDFSVPSYAPDGDALLSWTWQNREGNREFYQNCAQVNIQSSASRRLKRQNLNSFNGLPFIWKANLKEINECATTEGLDPVYPDPGPDAVYSAGLSASSAASSGTCDWPTPYGITYQDLNDSTLSPGAPDLAVPDVSSQVLHAITSPALETDLTTPTHFPGIVVSDSATAIDELEASITERHASITATPTPNRFNLPQKAVLIQDRSTITVTADCPSAAITVTITTTPATLSMLTTTRQPSFASPSMVQPAAIPYATGNINAHYLPCVPGSFLCTSSTTFWTCNYNDGTVQSDEPWVYASRDQRSVAAGMECLPMLSPYTGSNIEHGQQAGTPTGEYRDDRYVRARLEGNCDVNGSLQCTYSGNQFSTCDHGGWVPMGAVAAGTVCRNGSVVAFT